MYAKPATPHPKARHRLPPTLVCVGVLATIWLWPAVAATPKARPTLTAAAPSAGDAVLGKAKSETERCQECHGADGQGNHAEPGAKFARLAGQYPEYLVKQMRDFRSGARQQDVMGIMARSVDAADVADIAAYFASLQKMRGEVGQVNAAGRNLYSHGDDKRGIVSCVQCHGDAGQGKSAGIETVPRVGGQDSAYLERQLRDWRSGDRRNSTGEVMNRIARSLTDADIKSLAHYLSEQ